MKRKIGKKMTLNRETLATLDGANLQEVAGGLTNGTNPCSECSVCTSCRPTCPSYDTTC